MRINETEDQGGAVVFCMLLNVMPAYVQSSEKKTGKRQIIRVLNLISFVTVCRGKTFIVLSVCVVSYWYDYITLCYSLSLGVVGGM